MNKAIGLVEYKTTAAGITGADKMVKSADVDIMDAKTVCPGKYIVLISGKLSAVNAAIESGIKGFEINVIDSFILGNPHESIFKAISATAYVEDTEALGIVETFSAASIIVAADTAAKTSNVNLIEIRIARGMCGKSYMLLTGELAAVDAAVSASSKKVSEEGMLLDKSIIPNPDKKIWESIL